MLKLFAVLLGGRATGCNTELHDVVFAIGHSLEETYPQLIKKWFGITKRLHIDAVIELDIVDGHEVVLSKNTLDSADEAAKKLFFVNFGGYQANRFAEIHEVNFYVASSKPEVLARAKKELGHELTEAHCDDNILVDDLFALEMVDDYYLHLLPTDKPAKLTVRTGYFRLDVPEIIAKTQIMELGMAE